MARKSSKDKVKPADEKPVQPVEDAKLETPDVETPPENQDAQGPTDDTPPEPPVEENKTPVESGDLRKFDKFKK